MKRLVTFAIAALFAGSAAAQTVVQSRADGNRYGAVVSVPSTGVSYPSDTRSEARGVVLLTPAGVPYTGAQGGGATTGSTSNASDGQAATATNVPTASYNYLYNGATFDRWYGTIANGARMQLTTAIPAGTNAIGSITNTGFSALGSAGTALQQGTAAPTANSANVAAQTYFAGVAASTNVGASDAATQRVTLGNGSQVIGSVTGNQGYIVTTTNLAANAQFTTDTPRTPPTWASYYGCEAYAAGSGGTIIVIFTPQAGTSYPAASLATTAGTAAQLTVRVRGPATGTYSCQYNNGATATTTFLSVTSSFTAN